MENDLRSRIQRELNCVSAENGSNTPDFILAEFLTHCLWSFDRAVNQREAHYGRPIAIRKKPTIHELEKLLQSESDALIFINPDGSISAAMSSGGK